MNPLPTIALGPDGFLLTLPSDTGGSHIVSIPSTSDGIRVLERILRDRQRQVRHTIGTGGSPTNRQVQEWLKAERVARQIERTAEVKKQLVANGLGDIDISDLDL